MRKGVIPIHAVPSKVSTVRESGSIDWTSAAG
jgi:hypothetical protein